VVLDLVVQPTHQHGDRRSAADVAVYQDLATPGSPVFNLGETSGMPMWLGANDEPMSSTDFKLRVQ
jgi:hypothetical protein